jgi:hypothetical protein
MDEGWVISEALEPPDPIFSEALLDRITVAATEEVRGEVETEYARDGGEDETTNVRDESLVRHSYLRILSSVRLATIAASSRGMCR